MGVLLLVIWLVLPIVLGIALLAKRTQTKRLKEQIDAKENLLDEYRRQNAALQRALREARTVASEATPEEARTVVSEATPEEVGVLTTGAQAATEAQVAEAQAVATEQASTAAQVEKTKTVIDKFVEAISVSKEDESQKYIDSLVDSYTQPVESKLPQEEKRERSERREKQPIPSGVLLFGIGILLVLIAGAIFATTTWNILPAFGKIAVLLGAVAVFYGGAFIAEKKLELRNTSITFFILGSTFLAVINLAAGYFGWYGDYYTIDGEGQLMLWCISALITSACMIVGGVIYKTKILGLLGYYFLLLGTLIGSIFAFDDAVPVMICLGIVFLASQAFIQFVEYRFDIDVIATSFLAFSYVWEVIAVVLCLFFTPFLENESAVAIMWENISVFVLGIITLGMALWRMYQLQNDILTPESKISKHLGMIATGFAIVAFAGSMRFIPAFYQRMNVALFVFIAIYIAILVLKKQGRYNASIKNIVSVFAQVLIVVVMFAELIGTIGNGGLKGIVLLITATVLYVLEHLSEDNKHACASAVVFYITVGYLMEMNIPTESYILAVIVAWSVILVSVLAGRFIYKKVVVRNENGTLVDWISLTSAIMFAFAMSQAWKSDAFSFVTCLLMSAYLASFYKRSNYIVDRILLTISIGFATFICAIQPFFKIPSEIENEWAILFLMIAVGLISIVWRKYSKKYLLVWMLAIALAFVAEYETCIDYAGGYYNEPVIGTFKVVLYLAGIIALFVVAFIKKNRLLLIETGFVMVSYSVMSWDVEAKGLFILAAIFGVAYLVYLHMENMSLWAFLPLAQIYILLFGMEISTAWWLIVFVVVMVAGFALHLRWDTEEESSMADDLVNISGIIPVFAVWADGNDKWIFCGTMMLAIYVLSFYKRYSSDSNAIINKGILTAASIVVAIGWITQPWFELSSTWKTEWIIFAFMVVCLFNTLVVYKHDTDETWGWITFGVALICIIIQGENAIASGRVSDALILGVVMLGVLIWAYMAKRKQWFLLSAITLVAQSIYASRKFWMSIAWWVYLLVAGAVLIIIAARSEYKRRQGDESEELADKRHLFDGWTL